MPECPYPVRVVESEALPPGRIYVVPTWEPDWDDADDVQRWLFGFASIEAEPEPAA